MSTHSLVINTTTPTIQLSTNNIPVMNIAAGVQGPPGVQGPDGVQGSQGISGIQGIQGESIHQVASDWNQLDNAAVDFIKNKPTIPSLSGYATEGFITSKNYVTTSTLSAYALTSSIPTNTTQLTNDSGFITTSALSAYALTSALSAYALTSSIPTNTTQLTNDSGFITTSGLSITTNAASNGGSLTYIAGVFSFTPPIIPQSTDIQLLALAIALIS